ncbi:chromate transporter, partial [Escherichia coli]|uniref:chromate transporter n=1 Tax=Escherichia coli TaxID=562 RepID=UPI003F47FB74
MTNNPTDDSRPWSVFLIFLRLGLTSFGGPIAHLGYFRAEFVTRRRWLSERSYADLVALCQFLPGPASSQVGIAVGLSRAGYSGALAAWAGFTLPSAIALILFALGISSYGDYVSQGALHGLKERRRYPSRQLIFYPRHEKKPQKPGSVQPVKLLI